MYCRKCGKQIDNDSKFCRYCGAKTSESVADNKDETQTLNVEKIQDIENKQEVQPEVELHKLDKREKNYNRVTIGLLILFIAIPIIFLITHRPEPEDPRITKQKALANQQLYWRLDFASIQDGSDFYFIDNATDDYNNDIPGEYCVVFGVTGHKNNNSNYYLDDSIDNGVFEMKLADFKLSYKDGAISPLNSRNCGHLIHNFDLVQKDEFSLHEGEQKFILFELSGYDLRDVMSVKYQDEEIFTLEYNLDK